MLVVFFTASLNGLNDETGDLKVTCNKFIIKKKNKDKKTTKKIIHHPLSWDLAIYFAYISNIHSFYLFILAFFQNPHDIENTHPFFG